METSEAESIDGSFHSLSILSSCLPRNQNRKGKPCLPHEALFLVLGYLPVCELLAMGLVCRSLRDALDRDILPWLDIIVDRSLSSRLSDVILEKLTLKANGRLRSLALMNCVKITDDGLQRIVERNPLISKLQVTACTGLTPEGIVRAVKRLSQQHNTLRSLQIDGIYGLNKEHLDILCLYLQVNQATQQKPRPLLYHHYRTNPTTLRKEESDRVIDVGLCPKCNEVRMVFDCPRETCRRNKDRQSNGCRGCRFCVPRCEECGGCVDAEEVEESVCSDILCSECWLSLPKCGFCNKPYCKRHADRQCSRSGQGDWICDVCHLKYLENSNSHVG